MNHDLEACEGLIVHEDCDYTEKRQQLQADHKKTKQSLVLHKNDIIHIGGNQAILKN